MAIAPITNSLEALQFNPTKVLSQNSNEEQVASFSDYLKNALYTANDLQKQSEQIGIDFAAGNTDNIHEVMLAGEKAEIALQLTMQVRNKVLEAYNEIMRMQI